MKIVFYLIVLIFTFSIGFWSYLSRPLITAVPLCQISPHAELYRSKQIRIKAYLDIVEIAGDGSGEDYFSVSDFNDSCRTSGILRVSEELKVELEQDEDLKVFINELDQKNKKVLAERNGSGIYIGEVEITGEISTDRATADSPPFVIKARKIRQISPIRFLEYRQIPNFDNSKTGNQF